VLAPESIVPTRRDESCSILHNMAIRLESGYVTRERAKDSVGEPLKFAMPFFAEI
jgi:hypothetical protein